MHPSLWSVFSWIWKKCVSTVPRDNTRITWAAVPDLELFWRQHHFTVAVFQVVPLTQVMGHVSALVPFSFEWRPEYNLSLTMDQPVWALAIVDCFCIPFWAFVQVFTSWSEQQLVCFSQPDPLHALWSPVTRHSLLHTAQQWSVTGAVPGWTLPRCMTTGVLLWNGFVIGPAIQAMAEIDL